MSFSVGILYSAQEFTAYVSNNPLAAREFETTFQRFSLAKPSDILEVTTKCNWIDIHPDGICRITEKGKMILKENAEKSLRAQIHDLIFIEQPTWAARIPNGREEASRFFPTEVEQCFKEAGLLGKWDDTIIEWWDLLGIATRSNKSAIGLVTGRRAEKLTFEFEEKRIGTPPDWRSLESNFYGYDILSKVAKDDPTPRMIEVKGTVLSIKEAYFTLSRNEWETAETAKSYNFHLWCLKGKPYLIEVTFDQIKHHVPTNNGRGKWETTRIPFRTFHQPK
ncbi:MAG: DUF3883 domain-containing protein [Chitinophagaceae bacterium]